MKTGGRAELAFLYTKSCSTQNSYLMDMNISNVVLIVIYTSLHVFTEYSWTCTCAVDIMRQYDRRFWSGHWSGSDRQRTLSDQMDVVARPRSWTKTKPSKFSCWTGEQVGPPGNQRKDGVATLGLQNNFSTYQRHGIKNRTFYKTKQYKITYYQTYLNY